MAKTGFIAQNVNVVDVISEGPIHGLVGGLSGVYLDDVPVEEARFSATTGSQEDNAPVTATITFDGSYTGTVSENVDLSGAEVGNISSITLFDYYTTEVTLTNISEVDETTTATISTAPRSVWTDDWESGPKGQGAGINQAFLLKDDVFVLGSFSIANGKTGNFIVISDYVLEEGETYTLVIWQTRTITSIDGNSNTILLRSGYQGSGIPPRSGTYNFILNGSVLYDEEGSTVNLYSNVKKIDKLNVDFRRGEINQLPVSSVGGVGGSVGVNGNTQLINGPSELKMIDEALASNLGFTLFDIDALPNTDPDSKAYPGNPDKSTLATTATLLPAASFGLDTGAKIREVDEIIFSIKYNALQTLNLNGGDKETAYAFYQMHIRFEQNNAFGPWYKLFGNSDSLIRHRGNTSASVEFDHVVNVDAYRKTVGQFTDFQVRICRVTRHIGMGVTSTGSKLSKHTDKKKWQVQASASVSRMSATIKDYFNYPYSSLASLSFSSRQFDGIPKRSYLLKGKLVKVPTTYIPREYSNTGIAKYQGFWDGNFRTTPMYTDNPAWVFYDIVTNNRYGAGKWIKEEDIDKYALYRIARYCDELVEDGSEYTSSTPLKIGEFYKIKVTGSMNWSSVGASSNAVGTIFQATSPTLTTVHAKACRVEPRFRANIFLTKATEAYKVLKDFATVFLGILYAQDSKITAVQDAPQDPVYSFTKGNVLDGAFTYESTGARTRTNQCVVTWNDPTINYEPVPLVVEDRESIVRTGRIISENVVAFGATSESQAIRYGKWKLWTAQNQTEIVSFKTSLAAYYIKPGDVINVQDADRFGVSYSGRTSSATSTTLTFDRNVSFNSGSVYELSTLVTAAAALNSSSSSVTINDTNGNGTTYAQGEKIDYAWVYSDTDTPADGSRDTYVYTALDTEEKASNAFLDSNGSELIPTIWKPYSYVETHVITNPGNTSNSVTLANSATFDTTPSKHNIWTLKETSGGVNTAASKRLYKILSISEESPNTFGVSAVEYFDEKFLAIDGDYELGTIPSSVYLQNEPVDLPRPINPRIVLASDRSKPGEELLLEWENPGSEAIVSYEVIHNIETIDSPILSDDTHITLDNLPNGHILFRIRAISRNGNKSSPTTLSYDVYDVYDENVPRMQQGIAKGAVATAQGKINSSNQFEFQATNTSVASVTNPFITYTITGAKNVANISTEDIYYMYLDTAVPSLKLLEFDTTALNNLQFYRDVGSGNAAISTAWTSLGTISIAEGSNEVTGSGFNNSVELRDVLNLSSSASPSNGDGARVVSVISDTRLLIDRTFDTAKSNITGYRAAFRPDYANDCIFAEITKSGSTISTNNFITLRTLSDDTEGTIETQDDGTIAVRDGGISVDKIAANSITADKISANSINADKIAANSITTETLAANSITANNIAANSITTEELAANSVNANTIAANSINSDMITANSVVSSLITASTIQSSHIKANSIVSTIIDATTINASDITTSTLSALTANMGDITAGTLKGGTIPDANASPSGTESGAFMDLTGGKMVFGNASKHVLFDGSDLILSGVTIDANSIVNATAAADIEVKEDGTSEGTGIASFNFTTGLNLSVNGTEATISADSSALDHDSLIGFVANEHIDHSGVTLTAGNGLTGGGDITASRSFAVGAGTGISVAANSISTNDSAIVHDNLSGFVANEHIDHSTISLTAGDGLTGGGDITGDRSFAVDATVVRTSAAQTIAGVKTFSNGIVASGGISGLTLTSGISGSNYNITGVNELQINDPGEGIKFTAGSSGNMVLAIVDDASDNILRYSGTNAVFDVQGNITLSGTVDGRDLAADGGRLDGMADNANNYSLPTATASALGGVKIGSGININSGVISAVTQSDENFTTNLKDKLVAVDDNANNYTLPTASSSVLGGVKIGAGINIDVNGAITASTQSQENFTTNLKDKLVAIDDNANNYSLPAATSTVLGGVKDGARVTIDVNGVLSADVQTANDFTNALKDKLVDIEEDANNYSLPTASTTVLGGVKIGSGISISSGAISADTQSDENFTSDLKSRLEGIELNATADQSASEIRTLLGTATSSTSGLVKIGYTENNKNYPVELSSGQMFVNVPWTDNNTTYTAGSGLSLSGSNQFSVDSTVVRTSGAQTIAGNKTFSNNVTVTGNFTVNGTTTTINTATLTVEDNIIVVNSGQTGTPATTVTAGLEVERGDSDNVRLVYAETGLGPSSNLAGWNFGNTNVTADTFYGDFIGDIVGSPSSFGTLTTDDLTEGDNNLYYLDSRVRAAISGASGGGISFSSSNGEIAVDSTVVRTSGTQTIGGAKTLTSNLTVGTTTDSTYILFPDKNVLDNPTAVGDKRKLIAMGNSVNGGLWQTTGRGGLMLASADDSLILASGDVGRSYDPDAGGYHPNADNEDIYLLTDGSVRFMTNLQTASNYKQFIFDSSGNATIPNNIVVGGTVDGRDLAADGSRLDGMADNATNTAAPAITTDGSTPSLASGITAAEVRTAIGAGTSSLTLGTTSTTALRGDTAIPTVYNPAITLSAGNSGITMDSDNSFTLNQSGAETITISHADTSSQESVDNSNGTVIQDITLDTFGHITGINSVSLDGRYFTETESDARYLRKDSYNSNWTRLGYGTSGVAYWHKLARVTINGAYKDYQLRCDWTDRYNHGTLNIHIHSDNDSTADVWDAYIQQFGETNQKPLSDFKYYKSGSIVDVWIRTAGWKEWDYIRTDAVTEGTPTIVWYKEGDSGAGKTTTEPSGLTQFSDYTPWHPNNDGASSGLNADTLHGAAPSMDAGNSTIVQRNTSGYVFANYFNTTANDVSSGVTKIMVETGNDNYIRHGDASAVRGFINVSNGADVTPSWVPSSNPSYVSSLGDLSITSTATEINKLDGFTGVTADLNYAKDLRATGVTSTEFDYLDGVSDNIQTQLNGKQASGSYITSLGDLNITSTATEINKLDGFTGVTADLNYAKDLRATGVTSTEFDYLDGVTSSIQTQLNGKQASLGFTPYNSTNPSGFITNSTASLAASKITSGTFNIARIPSLSSRHPDLINTQDDITSRTESGFYQTSSATTGEGWPETSNSYYHMLSNTHSNTDNYYAMQLAADYYQQQFWFRSTNGSGTTGWNQVFHDAYHPNADKWTTPRTLTLTGAVTGSVNWDGSGNASLATTATSDPTLTLTGDASGSATFTNLGNASLSVTVANDSHNHTKLFENSTITFGASQLQWMDQNGAGGNGLNGNAPRNPTTGWYHNLIMNHANSSGYYSQISTGLNSSDIYFSRVQGGAAQDWQRIFADDYHPNADTLTTARNIGVTLSGDVTGTGSASFNGSAAIDIAITTTGGGGVTGVTAGTGLSGGGSGAVSLAVDLDELNTATTALTTDFIPIVKAATGISKKILFSEVIDDLDLVTGNVTGTLFAEVIQVNTLNANRITANTITAAQIQADAITANEINAGAITAEQLQISNNSSGSAGIFMDYNSGNSRIDIRDSSALRVRIGYLA